MLRTIRDLLLKIVDNIDCGNSNICEEDGIQIIDLLKRYTDKTEKLSKYKACEYLRVSRATFDNYIKEGKIPKGKKEAGYIELFWTKRELDECVSKIKKSNRGRKTKEPIIQ